MKAMVLAAGYGKRMRPLTEVTPKPLLKVAGKTLLERHLVALQAAGVTAVVVNAGWLADQIVSFCRGCPLNLDIQVSVESEPLETAGGILAAWHLIYGDDPSSSEPLLVVNGDIYCPYPFATLSQMKLPSGGAHLVLVDNPPHNEAGDFQLMTEVNGGRVQPRSYDLVATPSVPPSDSAYKAHGINLTYSGVGLYDPGFFEGIEPGQKPLKPLIDRAVNRGLVSGEHWRGDWEDVGTPQRLEALDRYLKQGSIN